MQLKILSRVISILLISFPLAALVYKIEQQDRTALQSFTTREDVLAYLGSFDLESFWLCLIVVVLAGFAYIGLIEGVALILRALIGRMSRNNGST